MSQRGTGKAALKINNWKTSNICFLVEIAVKTKKKDRIFDLKIRYLYIAVDLYEFLSAEAHHVSNQKIT